MRKDKLPERERKRIATRRLKHGANFDRINARHAGLQSPTQFNSRTGSEAAKLKWKRFREEKARKLREEREND